MLSHRWQSHAATMWPMVSLSHSLQVVGPGWCLTSTLYLQVLSIPSWVATRRASVEAWSHPVVRALLVYPGDLRLLAIHLDCLPLPQTDQLSALGPQDPSLVLPLVQHSREALASEWVCQGKKTLQYRTPEQHHSGSEVSVLPPLDSARSILYSYGFIISQALSCGAKPFISHVASTYTNVSYQEL